MRQVANARFIERVFAVSGPLCEGRARFVEMGDFGERRFDDGISGFGHNPPFTCIGGRTYGRPFARADSAGIEQSNVSFLLRRTHTTGP